MCHTLCILCVLFYLFQFETCNAKVAGVSENTNSEFCEQHRIKDGGLVSD